MQRAAAWPSPEAAGTISTAMLSLSYGRRRDLDVCGGRPRHGARLRCPSAANEAHQHFLLVQHSLLRLNQQKHRGAHAGELRMYTWDPLLVS